MWPGPETAQPVDSHPVFLATCLLSVYYVLGMALRAFCTWSQWISHRTSSRKWGEINKRMSCNSGTAFYRCKGVLGSSESPWMGVGCGRAPWAVLITSRTFPTLLTLPTSALCLLDPQPVTHSRTRTPVKLPRPEMRVISPRPLEKIQNSHQRLPHLVFRVISAVNTDLDSELWLTIKDSLLLQVNSS